jgi:hypothetical protein
VESHVSSAKRGAPGTRQLPGKKKKPRRRRQPKKSPRNRRVRRRSLPRRRRRLVRAGRKPRKSRGKPIPHKAQGDQFVESHVSSAKRGAPGKT